METLEIVPGDRVKYNDDSLFVHYGIVKRVNKLTYGILTEQGDYIRVEKKNVWWD